MAGIFSKSNLPKRPGAYFNFKAQAAEPVLQNTLGVVALAFTHSWGPSEQIVELGSFGDFLKIFGQGGTTPPVHTDGYAAIRQAFQGEGLPGQGGAGKVLAFRMVGASGAEASKVLQNTTPEAAITLTARYDGSYGNRLKVSVAPNVKNPGTHKDLVIWDQNTEVERWTFANTDITQLAADINGGSDWVTAGSVTSGTALEDVATPTALTGGDDGSTLLAADYSAFMTAVEPHRFSLLAAANLTDSSIITSLLTWSQLLNNEGKRFVTVVGGGTSDTIATAIVRSASLNDPNFVNVGGGTYRDEVLGVLSTAQLAPRIAGVLAFKGETQSITFGRLAGLKIESGAATESQIIDAIEGGVVAIARDSHPDAPIRLEKGVTTFTQTGDPDRPYAIYSAPKFVRTMHALESELTEFAEINVIGKMAITASTREYLVGQMAARLAAREAQGVIQPGWSVAIDQDPPPTDQDEFVALLYTLKFGRSVEQVLNTVVVG